MLPDILKQLRLAVLSAICVGLLLVADTNAQPPSAIPEKRTPANKDDSNLVIDFDAWEKALSNVANLRFEFTRTTTDPVFKKERTWTGKLLFKKPNSWVCRIDSDEDPTKTEFGMSICDGKSLFVYEGQLKTVLEYRITKDGSVDLLNAEQKDRIAEAKANVTDPVEKAAWKKWEHVFKSFAENTIPKLPEIIYGGSLKNLKQRFIITLLKEDDNYYYLNLKPKADEDKAVYEGINMGLFAPKSPHPFLTAKILILRTNGETETWNMTKFETNIADIGEDHFRYVKLPGFKFRSCAVPPNPEPTTQVPKKDLATPLIKPE